MRNKRLMSLAALGVLLLAGGCKQAKATLPTEPTEPGTPPPPTSAFHAIGAPALHG